MRYIAGILIAIGLVVLVIVLIIKALITHGPAAPTSKPLIDYAGTDVVMQMTIDGVVNADQNHREVQITVGSTNTQINIYQGYQQTVLGSANYVNNQNAYADFLRALDLAGYTEGSSSSALSDDRGYCATGERYIFEIIENGQDLQHYWSSSCGIGNFKGKTSSVVSLFTRQVPNYSQLTYDVNFLD